MATGGAAWAFTINALTFLGPIVSMVYLQRRGLGACTAEWRLLCGTHNLLKLWRQGPAT